MARSRLATAGRPKGRRSGSAVTGARSSRTPVDFRAHAYHSRPMEAHALASDSRPRPASVAQAIGIVCHSIGTGVKGVRRYGSAISAQYRVSKLKQFLRLSVDHYLNETSLDEFYRYQFYLPETWKSRGRHLVYSKALRANLRLLDRLASPDRGLLYNKDKFAAACAERNIPTIPVVAEFSMGGPRAPLPACLPRISLQSALSRGALWARKPGITTPSKTFLQARAHLLGQGYRSRLMIQFD